MNLLEIFTDIKRSFGGLWQTKQRGNSLEIITPYATTNNKFVSVFLSKQGNDYVVSDGGWLNSGIYEVTVNKETCFLKILEHFKNSFEIKQIQSPERIMYYYLKISNPIDIPSKLFDLTLFIQNIVSISEIAFEEKEEKETKEKFVSKANEYLKSFADEEKLKLNASLYPEKKDIKFNAIYRNTPTSISLVKYVTGKSDVYFTSSVSTANLFFEMVDDRLNQDKEHLIKNEVKVKVKVSFIDTHENESVSKKRLPFLHHLKSHAGSALVCWNEREKLKKYLN